MPGRVDRGAFRDRRVEKVQMTTKDQEKFYKSILRILEEEATTRTLEDENDRAEVATILTRRIGKGDLEFYKHVIRIFAEHCKTYKLTDELDRVRTARALAKEW